ncbi:TonB-dependent receptor domain-containing protein [Vibrio diazotrophicus]|uniref:TonB-dependent receptor domain-containing protein n=1 Tax=Vibrio diazotrophicus TaxID=685 RepID=UPI000C9E0D61|nr:TonB-dependent receptor [Vibrio diazotrophicus]PNH78599.1 ligand-gated channel protein [Vibrio diazotrophicus]
MSTLKRQALFVGGTAIITAPFAFAADAGINTTETMVVTAAGYEQVQTDAPASVTLITQEELSSKYYRDVTDALSNVPGVVVTGGGDSKDISIRGLGSQYTLMLVDGRRLSSRETRPNSDGPGIEAAWLPPLEAIERIEIIRGPMSTLYGSDAMGGVINIITKKSNLEWSGNVQLSTLLQENRDSGDEQNTNFFVTGPLTDSLSLQVYGQNIQRDEDNIENGYQNKTLRSIGSKLNYQISEQQEVSFTVETTKQERSGTEGLTVADGEDDEQNQYDRTSFALSHLGRWNTLGQSDSYIQYERNNNKSRQMSLENTVAKSTLVMPFEINTVSVGIQGEYSKLNDETSNTGGTITELSNSQGAIFVEDEWRALDNFTITAGARVDVNEHYGSHLSPRLYGVWNIASEWTLKGGVSTGFKAPQLRQASDDWVQVSRSGNLYGNSDLSPETMVSQELNLIYNADSGLQASLGLFNNDFKDKITSIECSASVCTGDTSLRGRPPRLYTNVDEAVTRGVEASLDTPIGESWKWAASYTYTYSKQLTGDMAGSPLTQLPKHLFSTQLDWQTNEQLNSWAKVTYRGKESDPSSFRDTDTAPSYTFVDAGITYQLTDNTRLKGAIYNLLDADISYEEYGYVEDGRRYWLGLDVNF